MNKYKAIGGIYRKLAKPVFFKFDPEFVHDRIIIIGSLLGKFRLTRFITSKLFNYKNLSLEQNIKGVKFLNPVGLSAGFDKNAKLINILPEVGFGFMEIGSVTLESYEGNPKPRLFRLPKSKGLVVYYGLMNDGVKKIIDRIKAYRNSKSILGISVAKTNCERTSTIEGGVQDYYDCLKYLIKEDIGDYYTINISCPNTFGGEPFTSEDRLEKLLSKLSTLSIKKPVFIKMPINLTLDDFDKLLTIIVKYKADGVIIGNLTKVHDPNLIKDKIPENIKGGISGKPTEKLSNDLIAYTFKKYGKNLIIIGVGGIFSAEDAYTKIKLGASLVQLITGMIFEGPQLIGEINNGIVRLLKQDGYGSINEVVGSAKRWCIPHTAGVV